MARSLHLVSVSLLMYIARMLKRTRCCECETALDLHQWLEGTQISYVCTRCAYMLDYLKFLPSLVETV